jgi:F0F1-type ATP synthase membrane subunit b/b'
MWLVGLAVSLGIFLVLYFTVIKSSTDTANNAIKSGVQQSQQALKDATKQLNSASSQAGAASSQAGAASGQAGAASSQASQQLSKAAKLTACVSAAGTDFTKIQACQAQYAH